MAKRKYTWNDKYRLKKQASPQNVGEWLEEIRGANGNMLEPKYVVAAASKKRSPAHGLFEWDDNAAAHEHRLAQARYLMRHLCVVYSETPELEPVRAFVHVVSGRDAGYVGFAEAMTDDESREYVLDRAKSEARSFRCRYNTYKELAEVIGAIDKLLA